MGLVEIVGVRFRTAGKVYYFDPKGMLFHVGDKAIVETVRGQEIGEIVIENRMTEENERFSPLSPVIRHATEEDFEEDAKNRIKEKEAFKICEEKIKKHELPMGLVDVEYTFDNSKIIFSFVADGRVDFRELVKDLAFEFKTRIELRQIGARDETRLVGGLGICGRPVCCRSFLTDFSPVSVKMAKDQSLSTNPQKISGTCGKLICCLNFEEDDYEEAYKTIPRVGSTVKTPEGNGTAVEVNVVSEMVRVHIDGTAANVTKYFEAKDISVLNAAGTDNAAETSDDEQE